MEREEREERGGQSEEQGEGRRGPVAPGLRAGGRLTAREAAQALGVSRDTLYAYVSRGLIRSEKLAGTRARGYRAEDVALLLERKAGRRDPSRAAREALHFGTPILESRLSLIADGRLYYRGVPVEQLAEGATIEQVASLLWTGNRAAPLPDVGPALVGDRGRAARALARSLPSIEGFQVALAVLAAEDPGAFERSSESVRRTGTRVLRLLAAVAADVEESARPVAEVLQEGWAPNRTEVRPLLACALVLWADHELNVGTFTARCVASAHATPYAAVIAGLSALRGALHGGASEQVGALFDEVGQPERARACLEARLRRGELIPGFGHPLYPDGDPRAAILIARIRAEPVDSDALELSDALRAEAFALTGRAPNIDFASATLVRGCGLPAGAALALTAIARSVGWVAHVLEQYGAERLIRPRARYTGEPPQG